MGKSLFIPPIQYDRAKTDSEIIKQYWLTLSVDCSAVGDGVDCNIEIVPTFRVDIWNSLIGLTDPATHCDVLYKSNQKRNKSFNFGEK